MVKRLADVMRSDYDKVVTERDALTATVDRLTSDKARLAAELAARDRTIVKFDFEIVPQMAEHIRALEAALLSARSRSPHVVLPSEMAACFPLDTPVSTLCAICDQIKELHPSTHEWTAKETEPSGMEIAQREADEAAGDNDPRDRVWGSTKETNVDPIDTSAEPVEKSAKDRHDYGCTGCRSTPCICATLETASEPEVYKGMKEAPAWIDDGAGGLVNLGMALSKMETKGDAT